VAILETGPDFQRAAAPFGVVEVHDLWHDSSPVWRRLPAS
jgi:hypothetical protein